MLFTHASEKWLIRILPTLRVAAKRIYLDYQYTTMPLGQLGGNHPWYRCQDRFDAAILHVLDQHLDSFSFRDFRITGEARLHDL